MEQSPPIPQNVPTLIEVDHILNLENAYRFYGETIAFTVFLVLGFLTNAPLLVIYFRSKHIRSIVDKFLFNMLIADALCVLVLLPTILIDLIFPESGSGGGVSGLNVAEYLVNVDGNSAITMPVGTDSNAPSPLSISNVNLMESSATVILASSIAPSWSCAFKKCLLSGVSTASILASLEIAIERFLAVVNPLHYHEFVTRAGVMLTSSVGSFIAIFSAVLSSLDPCQPVFPGCVKNMTSVSDSVWWPSYTLVHVTLFFIVPIIMMTFIYIKIWWEAKRQRAKMSHQCKRPFFVNVPNYGHPDGSMSVHEAAVEETKRGKRFYIHPILLRFKLIERLVAPRMDRAARVAICTLCVTILCWGPYYFVETSHALMSLLEKKSGIKAWRHYETIIPLFFASLHPIIAPFFYAYRYKRVRSEAVKMSGLDTCFHGTKCIDNISPRKSIVLDFHDTQLNSSASKTNQILTPVSSEVGLGIHLNLPDQSNHYYSPPVSPKLPRFHIGPIGTDNTEPDAPINESSNNIPPQGHKESHISLTVGETNGAKTTPFSVGSFLHYVSAWIQSHSPRWGSHRESVTSTSSILTLLSGAAPPNPHQIPAITITTEFPVAQV